MKIKHKTPPTLRAAPRREDEEKAALLEFMRLWLKEQKALSPAMSAFVKRHSRVIGS